MCGDPVIVVKPDPSITRLCMELHVINLYMKTM